ncbi:MAG: putative peptidoglycan binding domain [Verrucomicrobiota bacterium]|jgi:peptidoglycan hydrolase-like protein with peptidoglycan-binding domain
MKRTAFLFSVALLVCAAAADDRTRDVQAELKNQGFYFGEVNGKQSDEMAASVRRFQIRNGLNVTGEIDTETLAALGLGSSQPTQEKPMAPSAPEPRKSPQVNPAPVSPNDSDDAPLLRNKSRDLLVRERDRDSETSPERVLRGVPVDPAVLEPPRSIPNAVYDPVSSLFRGTPYATAPRELQEDTIAAAQRILQRERLYRGEVDGFAGPMTSEAIFNFQERFALRPTGRLDMDTLARMNLLPRVMPAPGARPFYNPNQRRDRSVLRGVWVR